MFTQTPAGTWPTWNAMMVDGFRFGAWLVALQSLASVELPAWLRRVSLGLCAALIVYTSFGAISQTIRRPDAPMRIDAVAGFITALAALAATLHVWRQAMNASREVRWCAAALRWPVRNRRADLCAGAVAG